MDDHHKRYEYCKTRLKYRQGRQLTAVKVYTVADESSHLLIFGVPKINLKNEIKRMLQKYGPLKKIECITDTLSENSEFYPIEIFTDVFHVSFEQISHSRKAKKFADAKSFYGGILHISYATELESVEDVREKLLKKKQEIFYRMRLNQRDKTKSFANTGIKKS